MDTIYVKDYVKLPCEDAAPGVRQALAAAKRAGAKTLRFEAGVYPLLSAVPIESALGGVTGEPMAYQNALVPLDGFEGLTLLGEVDESGEPATLLSGINTGELNTLLPSILWAERCRDLTVKNIALTRAPEFASAGEVMRVEGGRTLVRVFDGNPCYDGMGTYCLNRFTSDGRLNGESLSYGPGLGCTFHLVDERILELDDEKIASRVAAGDILTWHQGAKTDFQCCFCHSENLTLENVRTYNSNGFAMLAYGVHNITARRIAFRPRGNQHFTAPRDAWKLHKCGGRIEIDGMYVEGVRMDGQNVHNNYLFIREILSERVLLMEAVTDACDIFADEDRIEFFADEKSVGSVILADWAHIGTEAGEKRHRQLYRFELREKPAFVLETGMIALAASLQAESYWCHDSSFVNIAGAGHLMRAPHVLIERCSYRDTMNPGVMLGAEFPIFYEGGNCYDVCIRDCSFEHCGFYPRYGTVGCIGINSAGFKTDVNHDIAITGCSFSHSDVGVDIHKAWDVRVTDCTQNDIGVLIRRNQS